MQFRDLLFEILPLRSCSRSSGLRSLRIGHDTSKLILIPLYALTKAIATLRGLHEPRLENPNVVLGFAPEICEPSDFPFQRQRWIEFPDPFQIPAPPNPAISSVRPPTARVNGRSQSLNLSGSGGEPGGFPQKSAYLNSVRQKASGGLNSVSRSCKRKVSPPIPEDHGPLRLGVRGIVPDGPPRLQGSEPLAQGSVCHHRALPACASLARTEGCQRSLAGGPLFPQSRRRGPSAWLRQQPILLGDLNISEVFLQGLSVFFPIP